MRISREGLIPQIEPGPNARRLGGVYQLVQRTGVPVRILNTLMLGQILWSSTPWVRQFFPNIFALYAALAVLVGGYMVFDLSVILPFQQGFSQYQSQRSQRSPLKQDTEKILERLDDRTQQQPAADGGHDDGE